MNKYFFASDFVTDSVVLDVACNDGYGSLCMTKKGAKFVVGCDISKDLCIKAKKASKNQKNCEFIVCDARKLPFKNGAFDAIVSLDTIEHLDDSISFLSECVRTMKSCSSIVCSTPNRKATSMLFKGPLNPSHVKEFYIEEFVSLFLHFFEGVQLYAQEYNFTIGIMMKQLRSKFMNYISSFMKRREHGEFTKVILKRIRYLVELNEPWGKMPYASYDKFVDKKYEVTIFKDKILRTPCHIVCVASKPIKLRAHTQKYHSTSYLSE